MFVSNHALLALPVNLPDGVELGDAVVGLLPLHPPEGARLVAPAKIAVPEDRGRLHPHDHLVQEQAVALENGGNRRLLDVRVPDVEGSLLLQVWEAGLKNLVQKGPEILDLDLAVDVAPVLARGFSVVDRPIIPRVVHAV